MPRNGPAPKDRRPPAPPPPPPPPPKREMVEVGWNWWSHAVGPLPTARDYQPKAVWRDAEDDRYHLPHTHPYPRWLGWLLRLLQRRCTHHALKADILGGKAYPYAVRWCETCGGIWYTIAGTPCGARPRMPEPTWESRVDYPLDRQSDSDIS